MKFEIYTEGHVTGCWRLVRALAFVASLVHFVLRGKGACLRSDGRGCGAGTRWTGALI